MKNGQTDRLKDNNHVELGYSCHALIDLHLEDPSKLSP